MPLTSAILSEIYGDDLPTPTTLAAFRAGRLNLEGNRLIADTRKGMLMLNQYEDVRVVSWHLRHATGAQESTDWQSQVEAKPEWETLVFPTEAELKPVHGRSYVLKFGNASRDFFIWMQERDGSQDQERVLAFNTALNAREGMPVRESTPATEAACEPAKQAESLAAAEATAGATDHEIPQAGSEGVLTAGFLAAALTNAAAALGSPAAAASALAQQLRERRIRAPGPSLAALLTPEFLRQELARPGMLEALQEFLPAAHRTQAQMEALAHSPQFCQQLEALSLALQTGQVDLSQFGLQTTDFSADGFLHAVQDLVDSEQRSGGTSAGDQAAAGAEEKESVEEGPQPME